MPTRNGRALPKALIAWSSGKDSAWALHEARAAGEYDIVGALTTVTDSFGRVSMHGVREELLMAQLDAAGLPAEVVRIPYPCPNEVYEREMAKAVDDAKARGVTHIIFGDLYLEDIRAYREKNLAGTGITPVFPLWLKPTARLARDMIDGGVEAHLAVVDLKKLPAAFAGRRELGHGRPRSRFRHLTSRIRVNLRVQNEQVDVPPRRQHMVHTTEADVVGPAVAADDPDALLHQHVGESQQLPCFWGVQTL